MDHLLNQQENIVQTSHFPTTKHEEILESLHDSPEFKRDIHYLIDVYTQLFGTEFLGDYTCYTNERKQCSDGSLYTLIKYQGKDLIVKVWAGEFNTKVFTTGNVKELKWFYQSPIPLFVVNQGHSYLGDKEDKILRSRKPREYLDKFTVLVSAKWGTAVFRSVQRRDKGKIDYQHIHIRQYDDALMAGRLQLLKKTFPNWEFDDVVRQLKKYKEMDFEQFYKQVWKWEKFLSDEARKLINCLRHMWIYGIGRWVWDLEAFHALYDLIQSFDVHKKYFTSLQPQPYE